VQRGCQELAAAALASGALAVDAHGVLLGRTGQVSVLALCAAPRGTVYIVDVTALGARAFAPPLGLRALLEAGAPQKLFFDVRADANALFYHFGVALPPASVADIQLLDTQRAFAAAARAGWAEPAFFRGWKAVLEHAKGVARADVARAGVVHEAALRVYAQDRGGSFAPWVARPLDPVLVEHASDVRFFADVARGLATRDAREAAAVASATRARLEEAQTAAFSTTDRGNGRVGEALAGVLAGRAAPAAAPAPAPAAAQQPAECSFCLDAAATHACVPCGHKCLARTRAFAGRAGRASRPPPRRGTQ
jgi:exonuclease 3'-5' domain-containing protein 1